MTDTRDVTVEEARKLADDAQRIIGKLCSELRTPRMSVPVQPDDEDVRILEAAHALKNLATQVARSTAGWDALRETSEHNYRKGNEHHKRAIALAAENDALREGLRQVRGYLERTLDYQPGVYFLNVFIDALLTKEREHVG